MSLPNIDGYSFWLTFGGSTEQHLQREINRFAVEFGSVVFQPHITLASVDGKHDEDKLMQAAKNLNETLTPFYLNTGEVRCSSNPYQKLTIEIPHCDSLDLAHNLADQLLGGEVSKRAYPHISLIYSQDSCTSIERFLEKEPQTVPEEVQCRGVSLVKCKGVPQQWVTLKAGSFD
ncbi:MAG: hypothetical protein GVY02_08310 [Bacteroidetes bacterium]|nr:hypothetical protein [Bacteroidota bacterium]